MNTKFGTFVDESVVSTGSIHTLSYRTEEVSIRVGKLKTDNTRLILKWHPIVITFSSGEEISGHNELREQLVSRLEPLDIKLLNEFHPLTTHFLKTKKNSSKVLYALVKLIPIVSEDYVKAIQDACDSMETDFLGSFPDPSDFLPDPKYAINFKRKNCLNGMTFVFGDIQQREALLSVITAAGGKCLQYDLTEISSPKSIVDFVKSHSSHGILISYPILRDNDPKELMKSTAMAEAAKLLGICLLDPIEFLTAILNGDGSGLYKKRPDTISLRKNSTTLGNTLNDKNQLSGAQLTNSFLVASRSRSSKPPSCHATTAHTTLVEPKVSKRVNIADFFKREPSASSVSSSVSAFTSSSPSPGDLPTITKKRPSIFGLNDNSKKQRLNHENMDDKTIENNKETLKNVNEMSQPRSKVSKEGELTQDILSQASNSQVSHTSHIPPQLHIKDIITIAGINEDEILSNEKSSAEDEPREIDINDLKNLAIVENSFPVERTNMEVQLQNQHWEGLPNFKGFRRSHGMPEQQSVTLVEVQNVSTRIESDVSTMFKSFSKKREVNRTVNNESSATKRMRLEQEQVEHTLEEENGKLFFDSDDDNLHDQSSNSLTTVDQSVRISGSSENHNDNNDKYHDDGDDDDDDDEFAFKFTT